MDLTPAEPSNIIALNGSVESQFEITRKERAKEYQCTRHKRVVIDSEMRTVTCRDCGYIVDPFAYIEQWAKEGESRMEELKSVEIRCRVLRAEEYDLNRKVKNLRQRLKRAGEPQSDHDRREFDMMRWNPQNAEYQEKLRIIEGGMTA